MNTANNQVGVNTAGPQNDLKNNSADNDQVNVTAASGGGDIHDHGRHPCYASRTTTMNNDTSSTAPPGQPQVHVQLATMTATLNNTSHNCGLQLNDTVTTETPTKATPSNHERFANPVRRTAK